MSQITQIECVESLPTWNTPTKGGLRLLWTFESLDNMVISWRRERDWTHMLTLSGFVLFNPSLLLGNKKGEESVLLFSDITMLLDVTK